MYQKKKAYLKIPIWEAHESQGNTVIWDGTVHPKSPLKKITIVRDVADQT